MAGSLQLAGAPPSKPPKFACLYSSRYYSGLVTNRSPLRSAGSAYEERYLGTRADALIDGQNCEITPRLTLARRPGNPVYNSNSFSAIKAFYSFREFGPNSEQIRVMADTASTLYDATGSGQISVFSKSAGSGQTYMQSVANTLFFANGVDQKKWVQSLFSRATSGSLPVIGNSTTLNAASTPFIDTYLVDSNGNLQELYGTSVTTISNVTYVSATNTLTLTVGSTSGIVDGTNYISWNLGTATWLNGISFKVLTAVGTTVTANLLNASHANYSSASDTGNLALAQAGTPVTGGSVPTWSTQTPSSSNNFQGGVTIDGTAIWVNRGNPVENWGLAPGTSAPTAVVGASSSAWQATTFFSLAGAVVDTQFAGQTNIWQVTTAGKSGSSNPFTTNPTSGTTTVTDGAVTWKCVASTHSGDSSWQASTTFSTNHLIVANANGTNCLFQLQANAFPVYKQVTGTYVTANFYPHASHFQGQCELRNPTDGSNNPGSGSYPLNATATGNSVLFNPNQTGNSGATSPLSWATLSTAGDITGYTTPYAGAIPGLYTMLAFGTMTFPASGQYSFTIFHDDGMFWGMGPSGGNQPTRISGPNNCPAPQATLTPLNGYQVMGANNVNGVFQDTYVVNIPAAGDYPFEIAFAKSGNSGQFLALYCNGQTPVPGTPTTGTAAPIWPTFSTSFAPNYASINERNNSAMGGLNGEQWPAASTGKGPLSWNNLGPITDSVWTASVNYTLPDATITDPNNNAEAPFRAGVSGVTIPTFATGQGQLTNDNPNLIWINQGPASAPTPGTLSTFNGGFQYCVVLVNSATNTVSNASPLTAATGNHIGFSGVLVTGGIPATASIDPQADFVAIFRTTDGQAVPFLIPGTTNSIYTCPLPDYLANGYLDTTTDEGLNNLIEAPIAGENTVPALGAKALTYHLSRIWFAVGNTVYWTSGPDTPVGNGVEGVLPTNTQSFPSLVTRIVPTTVGAFVFTVSDLYLIPSNGNGQVLSAVPWGPTLGLLSYNALDILGSSIGFFASDSTFNVIDISAGPSEVGFQIGNLLQSLNPSNVYVTWHSAGEDKAWFVSDGSTGWYRVSPTPAPEQGVTWSPKATIVGGCQAVQSIETSPGVHQLLLGPTSSGPILARSLSTFTDNSSAYTWFAVCGSHVLANPGQVAEISFVTTESVATGTPLSLSIIVRWTRGQ